MCRYWYYLAVAQFHQDTTLLHTEHTPNTLELRLFNKNRKSMYSPQKYVLLQPPAHQIMRQKEGKNVRYLQKK